MKLFELTLEWLVMTVQDAIITAFIYVAVICFVTVMLIYTAYKHVYQRFITKPKVERHEKKNKKGN